MIYFSAFAGRIGLVVALIWIFALTTGRLPIQTAQDFWLMYAVPLFIIATCVYVRLRYSPTYAPLEEEMLSSEDDTPFKQNHPISSTKYDVLDALLENLDEEERAYLERKLGAGELFLSDDGELVTIEEYKRRKK